MFESNSLEEVEIYLRRMEADTTRYYVYYDNYADRYYIRELNCSKGTIQDNKPNYNAHPLKCFDTYEEAETYIQKLEA